MRVMGLDLGRKGAVVILTDEGPGKPRVLATAAWDEKQNDWALQQLIYRLGREHQVALVATEAVIQGGGDKYQRIAFAQEGMRRLAKSVCDALQIPLRSYPASTIKAAVGAKGRVTLPRGLPGEMRERLRREANAENKKRVARCVAALIEGTDPTWTEHQWDAAAIALVALSRERARHLTGQTGRTSRTTRTRRARSALAKRRLSG